MAIIRSKRINSNTRNALKNVLLISLLTGTLDGIAAILWIFISAPKISLIFIAESVFKFIASGAYGKAAEAGGSEMVVSGIIFHYIIAFLFTTVFYQLYPSFKAAFKNKYIIGVFYGVFAWVIMNMLVIPLSKIGYHPIKLVYIFSGMAVLVICVGLPIALIADWHLKKIKKQSA